MYYEEKIINGILMFRNSPRGDWQQVSIESMSERIVALQHLECDNAELRAQLARCVDALNENINPRLLEGWDKSDRIDFFASIVNSLSQQAKLDAEVLRCAYMLGEFFIELGNDCKIPCPSNGGIELYHAVRAAKGGE